MADRSPSRTEAGRKVSAEPLFEGVFAGAVESTEDQRHEARTAVCAHAANAGEARDLMLALGLIDQATADRHEHAAQVEADLLAEASEWASLHDWMRDHNYLEAK